MQTTQKYVCSYLRGKEYKEYPSQTSWRIEAMSNLTLTCPVTPQDPLQECDCHFIPQTRRLKV